MDTKFSLKLKNLRTEKELTQKEMARILEISHTCYAGYEQGYREPDLKTIIKIADFFECSIDYLTGREDDFGCIVVPSESLPLSSEEQKMIKNLRSLPQDLQHRAVSYVDKLAELIADEKETVRRV